MMNAGDELYEAAKYSISMTFYNKAIKLKTDNAIYYSKRSLCLAAMGDYKNALNDGQEAIALDDKSEKGYECIIKCCLALGDIDGAEAAIEKISQIRSNDDICKQYKEQLKQLRPLIEMATESFKQKHFDMARMYQKSQVSG